MTMIYSATLTSAAALPGTAGSAVSRPPAPVIPRRFLDMGGITGSGIAGETAGEEVRNALRWRAAVLRLSTVLLDASSLRPELTPVLSQAFEYATSRLLTRGDGKALLALEDWLKQHEADASLAKPNTTPGQSSASSRPHLPRKPISTLLVDDNRVFLASATRFLATAATVAVIGSAESAYEAIAKVKHLRPELVLMDVAMPGVDGLEATTRLKQRNDSPRVIVLTLDDSDEGRAAARAAQADGYVPKARLCSDLLPAIAVLFA